MRYRLGIDIGGTFTDFTLVSTDGQVWLWKEDSTPGNSAEAIESGLAALATERGVSIRDLLADTDLVVHGTTIATNMLIQRSGPRIGLLATDGFRDVLYFRDGFKAERFNIRLDHPGQFVDRYLRFPVRERVTGDGHVELPLVEADVHLAAQHFRTAGVEAVAVAFLWSIVNPVHELRAAEILRELLPDLTVVTSHDVLPEIREWERTSAATISAYIVRGLERYLTRFEEVLRGAGMTRPPMIMQINGGCAAVPEILRRPINALASGPAAAPAATQFHLGTGGSRDAITIDMGGTSFDVCVLRRGAPAMSRNVQVEQQPVGVAAVEVHSVGAGGGSIAWIDDGGALRVGPRSAGSSPGPAAYGRGGTEPTVTDANVVAGYLVPEAFLGGRRRLRDDLAYQAITSQIAGPLGIEPVKAAAGILRVVNWNMISAIRAVSVERGIDPRTFNLVVGGGAGGLHATRLARALGIRRVIVPREAGALCSFGMTVTNIRHDHLSAFHTISTDANFEAIDAVIADLEEEARAGLAAEGFAEGSIRLQRLVDARYPGQVHELTVPAPDGTPYSGTHMRAIERAFHEAHAERYTYARPELPVELLHWRVTAFADTASALRLEESDAAAPGCSVSASEAQIGTRDAYFDESGGLVPTPVYASERLVDGVRVEGPAIVAAPTTTIVLNPGDVLSIGPGKRFEIDVEVMSGPQGQVTAPATAV